MTNKPALVFLHGHGVTPASWDFLHSSLANEYAIIRPDFSRLTQFSTIDQYADELQGQLGSSEIGPCVLIGHSMGGYVALALAANHPDRVAGLVLLNSTAFADPDTDEQRQKRQDTKELLETAGTQAFVEKTMPLLFAEVNREVLATTIAETIGVGKTLPKKALLAALEAIRTRPDRSALLADAPYPVLLIAGRHDVAIPVERSEELAQKLPDAESVILERSGHMSMLEEPEAVLLVLKPFLVKISVA